jgi:hypothetical protein
MKKTFCILFTLVISTMIFSCRTHRIDKKYYNRVPYNGNEILVFESSEKENDTIFLKGTETFKLFGHRLFQSNKQYYTVSCDCADPYSPDRIFRDQSFVSLSGNKDGKTYITIRTILRNAYFQYAHFSIAEFDDIPLSTISINDKYYTDVKIVESKERKNHENFADRFYWSVSEGFLGLDKGDLKWRLTEKYVPQQSI